MKLPEKLTIKRALDAVNMLVILLKPGTLNPQYDPSQDEGTVDLRVIRDNPSPAMVRGVGRVVFAHLTFVGEDDAVCEYTATCRVLKADTEVAVVGPFPFAPKIPAAKLPVPSVFAYPGNENNPLVLENLFAKQASGGPGVVACYFVEKHHGHGWKRTASAMMVAETAQVYLRDAAPVII